MKAATQSEPVNLAELFPLSSEELERLSKMPAPASEADWRAFASSMQRPILTAYADRDITFRRMLEIMRGAALGCAPADRITLLGLVAERALQTRPNVPHRTGKRPEYPRALIDVAVTLVLESKERNPTWPLCPTLRGKEGESHLEHALKWLQIVKLFKRAPSWRTLNRWYVQKMKALGHSGPRGRPRKT